MNSSIRPRVFTGLTILAASLLAACAAPMNNSNLEAARVEYTTAASDPVIAQSAPKELVRAQEELQRGDLAFKDKKDAATVDHFAYLAHQRTQVAIEAARITRADQAAANAQTQRDRIVLASRTREAEQARGAADQARSAAEQAKMDADAAKQQALASQQRAGALEDQLAALQAKQTDRGMVLTLGDVLFDTGRATLKSGAMRTIDNLAAFMQQHPERKVLIEGYTDSVGSDSMNQELSERRADSVRDALALRNVSADRVTVHGLGERYPVASNDSGSGRQLNRRVEIVFSNAAGMFQAPRS
ncbi:MAG: OmpA family protein [Burkholderiaceae bacterium]